VVLTDSTAVELDEERDVDPLGAKNLGMSRHRRYP
jgi:hypothetical protein